jgi:peroxiredoxin Q/BCP
MDLPRKAPDFALLDQDGATRSLVDYAGKWLVIYFYPKDSTPGCTTEACSFRDERELVAELGNVEVIGVSKDSVRSHKKFADAHNLTFTLLSDPDHQMIEAYDSWNLRKFMGREYMGTQRNTFIISPDGNIVTEFRDVKPQGHAKLILDELTKLQK